MPISSATHKNFYQTVVKSEKAVLTFVPSHRLVVTLNRERQKMRLTNDEAILAAFNGTDSTARDLAGRLEEALEKVDELKLALKQIEMAPDFAAVNGVLETLEY